jgi:N-acetylmuramoyl-L-alanine amidase
LIHPPRAIAFVVVHTCGAYDPKEKRVVHQTMETVRKYHMAPVSQGGKGWMDIGYHRYIERDGKIRPGRMDVVPGAHVEGFNAHTLGVCCSGDADYEPFNAQQIGSLIEQCVSWCRQYDLDASRVIGHRETDDYGGPKVWKTCPGELTDMDLIRSLVARELGASKVGQGMPSV